MEAAKESSHRPGLESLGRISLSGILACACKCREIRNNQGKVANDNRRHILVGFSHDMSRITRTLVWCTDGIGTPVKCVE